MCGNSGASGPEVVTPETTLSHPHSSDISATTSQVHIPESTLCSDALALLTSAGLPRTILNHSFRVYMFARWLAQKEGSPLANNELLFVACILHDLGASHSHDGPQRFEVEGADAAAKLIRDYGMSEAQAHEVWVAIAIHTSPGIAERISPLARLVRMGVLIDFRPPIRSAMGAVEYAQAIEAQLPRLDIEKVLGDAVVEQAVKNPGKAPAASWPNNLYKSHLEDPTWEGVNRAF